MDCYGITVTANDVLRRLHHLFRKCLDFQSISPHLRLHNLLTDHECHVISEMSCREYQVDELLKCLSQKGESCLHALIECLRSSMDHAGHKELLEELRKQPELRAKSLKDFEKAVNTISCTYYGQIETICKLESRLEELNKENILLREKLDEFKQSKVNYDNHLKGLENLLSEKDAQIQRLSEQVDSLQGISDSSCEEDEYYDMPVTEMSTPIEETNTELQSEGLSLNFLQRGRSISDITQQLKVPTSTQDTSFERKLTIFRKSMTKFHKKYHHLKSEKAALVKTREELENELFHLKDELDAVSPTIHGSIHNLSYSSLPTETKQQANTFEETFEGKSSTSKQSQMQGLAYKKKMTSKSSAALLEHDATEASKVSVSTSMEGNEPLYQGWLLKEGGHKKYWRKRWCVLSSHFFFYFEGRDDPATKKRPLGILPITPEMKVSEHARDNMFEISDKLKGYMKSCKLNKSKGGYVQGNHLVYKFQASTINEKERWVQFFKRVLENLKQQDV